MSIHHSATARDDYEIICATLVNAILKHSGKVKYRLVSTNKALSTTGFFIIDESFKSSLEKCGI